MTDLRTRDQAEDAAVERHRRGEAHPTVLPSWLTDDEDTYIDAVRSQAEDAQEIAEEQARAESDRADRERDRADGAEAHARALLSELVWCRAAELGYDPDRFRYSDAGEPIVDSLWDDMEGGITAADLSPDVHLHALFEENGR